MLLGPRLYCELQSEFFLANGLAATLRCNNLVRLCGVCVFRRGCLCS
jgi:hypothetical protein